MKLLEHEAKAILGRFGLEVPKGETYTEIGQLDRAMERIKFPAVVKGQVPEGGRGKAGAVRKANGPTECIEAFRSIIGMDVKGNTVASVLVEESVEADRELYMGITVDRNLGRPVLIIGRAGGIDIERSEKGDMESMVLDPFLGVDDGTISQAADFIGAGGPLRSQFGTAIRSAWNVFSSLDCELVEINPFVMTEGRLVCLDAKMVINDDSLFRHGDMALDEMRGRSPFERECRRNGFTGVELDGDVAVIANGAGLTMAVLDTLDGIGARGGAFLDLGGADDPERISKAISIVQNKGLLPKIDGLMVCIFGGLTECDVVARGMISSLNRDDKRPIVVRLRGANEIEGNALLKNAGYAVHKDLDEACTSLKAALEGGK